MEASKRMQGTTLLVLIATPTLALNDGLALLPPMGWRSWNTYGGDVTQEKMETIMDKMAERTRLVDGVPTSFIDLGYNNCGLDDNWQKCGAGVFNSFHDADGNPLINLDRFPNMSAMTEHGHKHGLRVGWYMNNCICWEKSWTGQENITKHMKHSAQAVADFGFDGVKLDGCGQFLNLTWWAQLLNATGRKIMVENCHWGLTVPNQTVEYSNKTCAGGPCPKATDGLCTGTEPVSECPYHFFRTSHDITNTWTSMHTNLLSTLPYQGDIPLSRPGAWAYPDMLEVGRMGSVTEDRTHFGAWVITSSPLILGFDMRNDTLTDQLWPFIANREAIAISQSWSGHPGRLIKNWTAATQVHAGRMVFAIDCDPMDTTQQSWAYDLSKKAIRGPGGMCLESEPVGTKIQGTGLFLNACNSSNSAQKFTLGGEAGHAITIHQQVGSRDMCIDIDDGIGPGAKLYSCFGIPGQHFVFAGNGALESPTLKLCFAGREYEPALGPNMELWAKPLAHGKVAAFVMNKGNQVSTSFNLSDLKLSGSVAVRDVWAKRDLGSMTGAVNVDLAFHDSALFVLDPTRTMEEMLAS